MKIILQGRLFSLIVTIITLFEQKSLLIDKKDGDHKMTIKRNWEKCLFYFIV